MANLNKVMLIGRLTRKPEEILIRGERAGAKFGFAVNNRKLDQDTQKWIDVPVYLDVEIWNRGESKQADRVLETLRGPDRESGVKASQIFIEGHLRMDEWTDQATQKKRTKIVVVVESFQYLDARQEGGNGGEERNFSRAPRPAAAPSKPQPTYARNEGEDDYDRGAPSRRGGDEGNPDDIPF
jgi:single-strand DNA-binding protein